MNGQKHIQAALLLIVSVCMGSPGHARDMRIKTKEDLEIERKVEELLKSMTLEEKIGQMTQVRHFDDIQDVDITEKFIGSIIHTEGPSPGEDAAGWQARFIELQQRALATRLGIPLLFGVDAIHGQNTFPGATIFPHNIGLGASGNAELVQMAAAITAKEAQATGFNWVFSPCIAIPFNEKWGRVYEAFSESTALTEKLTRASVLGHQGRLSDKSTVMATAKHFIGDGSTEYGIEGGETTLRPQEVEERLLSPYREAVNCGVGSVMTAFNTLDGIPMHAHKRMITDVLKESFGFDGIVVTDWKGFSKYGENAIINAGVDMVMAVDGDLSMFWECLYHGVAYGEVPMERIDDAVRRILRQKYRLGLFENPFPAPELISSIGCDSHREVARQAVRESLVLLKNERNLLPLDQSGSKIVVVGEHANNSGLQSGGWTINWQGVTENYPGATTILEGIKEKTKGEVIYDYGGVDMHPDADAAIICIGERPYAEFFGDVGHEESDCQLTLTNEHQQYIANYKSQGVKTVVVLFSGRPLVITEALKQADAFVAAWLPGSEGAGVADVLFGDHNFTGKLPHSWPATEEDYENPYGPNFWDKSLEPLFPLGYGLEYQEC